MGTTATLTHTPQRGTIATADAYGNLTLSHAWFRLSVESGKYESRTLKGRKWVHAGLVADVLDFTIHHFEREL